MAILAKHIKERDPNARCIFVGPCIAKKTEAISTRASEYVDYSMTFEEMQAMFGAKGIDPETCEDAQLRSVSSFGRGFARCGGLAEAVQQALNEQGVTPDKFALNPIVGDGLAECKKLLTITKSGKMKSNFIEGMACKGGCVGGPACLSHNPRALALLDKHKKEATGSIQHTVEIIAANDPSINV
jgi:iron only hydrogenase large subunit-like protein